MASEYLEAGFQPASFLFELGKLMPVVASVPVNSRARIDAELAYARAARDHGKEGRARVCARRAAGWAVAAHYPGSPKLGAYSILRWLESQTDASVEIRSAAGRLSERVNEDHKLPHSEDPLKDAETIVAALLGSNASSR